MWSFLAMFLLLPVWFSSAQEFEQAQPDAWIESLELGKEKNNYTLSANISLNLGDEVRNAAERGVPLYFTLNMEVLKQQLLWFDTTALTQQHTWRIQYNALLRQWRISNGELSISELSLDDSLQHIIHLESWPIENLDQLDPAIDYKGRLRLKLDTSLLPRPFQINAFNSSAWSLSTPWKNFTLKVSDIKPNS
ncbi:DUF4390 domain-containing protein [Advenella sp. RU8]|uniref:DUF4390 domain-containing protein n=1 Tax=Advenella sp. RU8 TaxID=3399575 RepID=UPI003AAEF840